MTRPSFRTWLLGHPLTVLAAGGATLWSVMVWAQGGNGMLALLAVIGCGGIARASQHRSAYLAYRREWDSLAPTVPPRRAGRGTVVLAVLLAVLALGGGAYYFSPATDQPGHVMALVGIAGAGVVAAVISGIVAVMRAIIRALARRRARHAPRTAAVAVCIARPLLPVPSLTDAYRALPAYCWRILS